ncbi:type III secretion system protein YscQ/HrcQ [Desulfosarcina variabilis str. Montpellier]|uniref:type III secretion system cytoplasmic ring protein SctQ n=1 Tax=Desulfosarcina variabilis TaxID=2300 RepID=UPI003AFA2249
MENRIIIKKINPKYIHIFNRMFKCKRHLEFDLGEEKYSVNFSFFKKRIESSTNIVVCIDDRLFYILTLENEFISNTFGEHQSMAELNKIPVYLRNIALEIAAEQILDSFEKYCNCKSTIVESSKIVESEEERIYLQFELLREKDSACFHGSIETNPEGMVWFLEKYDQLPSLHERKGFQIPLKVNFEIGYTLMSIEEIDGIELNDIILIDNRLSPQKSHVIVNMGDLIIFDGHNNPAGKIVLGNKAIQRIGEDMEKEENKPRRLAEPLIGDIPVKLTFKVGETQITFAELMDLQPGYIFEMNNGLEKPVEIKANGKSVGMGELVEIGDRLGVRVLEFETEK